MLLYLRPIPDTVPNYSYRYPRLVGTTLIVVCSRMCPVEPIGMPLLAGYSHRTKDVRNSSLSI